ncbi:helix-turn-helix transcriptional regulator [Enterococcus faecalis]|uniref:helix-turn-helix domain-containing protein n=1 Tax=Enterococcus faecalis TaxID=1351 RepID=UPI000DEB245A|nr:helix-turn-helix transcriptional regulator [Enterococcus faecalis]EGO8275223.1 helix-turn-helix transcriptional regulator [Enterococcus faecalis]EGO9002625.1 XRE family transcriptional regulator [Enterococcus faecalis]MDB1624231.1 helix-turn-helix transcriptional regulator [Enterococcus faecalis]MDH5041434.1 helix-turn-helix transcriptional regulator [Enterococcus faecalis]NSW11901.1 helix-turn-helix transcriptional regulator [Enterococcus faecalis]
MDVLGALKYFRKKKKIAQKDVLPKKGKQTYRRIEIGEAKLSYEDLMTALQSLGITFNEFFFMVSDTRIMASSEVKHQIECCQMGLNNTSEKKNLIHYFYQLERNPQKNALEMSIYTDIKLTFSNDWEEIPEFDETDRMAILALISSKSYYTYYDYQMVTNPAALFSENEVLQILEQMFPVKDAELRDTQTLNVAYGFYLNIITGELYKKNYAKAREYLALVSVTTIPAEIYYIHFNLRYLKNLTYYLYTGKMRYYKEVIAVIDMIESFGDVRLAEGMKKEMLQLTAGRTFNLEKGQFPLNIVTEK